MALQIECPKCKNRVGEKKEECSKCGQKMKKLANKTYWIDYWAEGKRKRERIGSSKVAAQNRLRTIKTALVENRYIDQNPAAKITLGELSEWYLQLEEVKAKRSYSRDKSLVAHLLEILGSKTLLKDLNRGKVETYMVKRSKMPSNRTKNDLVKPATINKEVSCLNAIMNRAVKHGKLEINPITNIKKLVEDNVRARILTKEEFSRLYQACPEFLKPIVAMAFYQGMRQGEILNLTWDKVDMKEGFIRLKGEDTKTNKKRSIPLHPIVKELLQSLNRGIGSTKVFQKNGKPIAGYFGNIRRDYVKAVEEAELGDFTFHDLRHCAVNNLRLAGNDFFTIMAISGHTTTKTFQRYNLVTEEELKGVAWKS